MKKLAVILFCLPALCWFISCNSGSGNSNGISTSLVGKVPSMVFTDTTHDFGSINQGEKVSYTFKFKNTGNVDLVISSATGSCGCTVPKYPKGTIHPGDEGQIDVTFDSSGKQGKVEKMVSLVTNCQPNTKILTITADIQVPKIQQ
ncbi:MAG: DUF1573 domain-containing protein [Bacteroidia bacterium]